MNTLNRILIVLLALGLMVGVTIICISPEQILTTTGDWLHFLGASVSEWSSWLRISGGIVVALVFDLLMALWIFFEVRPKPKRFIRVKQASGGMVTINDDSIVQQLQYELDPVPGILDVRPTVKARGNKVQVLVHVSVAAGANVPTLASQLVGMVQSMLADDLGLQIYKAPEVRIKVAPAPEGAVVKSPKNVAPSPAPVKPVAPAPKRDVPPALPRNVVEDAPSRSSRADAPPPLPDPGERA